MRTRALGASGLFILVILVLVALGVLAAAALSRVNDWTNERQGSTTNLAKAGAAIESFAAASWRLPCPSNPAVDDGIELTNGNDCQFRQGTLPWNTIGMRRDDAYDAWGHKLSYRVYTGGNGSLTQPSGISMVNCDIAVDGGGAAGTICQADHSTLAANFLAGKGLTVIDFGVNHTDTAYVVLSHGPTGLGSYTSSGVQLDLPKGDEKDNTNDTGPFHVEAFSSSNTGATDPSHFDDLLYYRSITSVVNATNLQARSWANVLTQTTFDRNTLTTALGFRPNTDTGVQTIALPNVTVSAFDSNGAQDISALHGGGFDDSIGGVNGGGGDGLLSSAGGEFLTFDLNANAQQVAFTLENFFTTGTSAERVQVLFFQVSGGVATLQGSQVVKQSCSTDNKSETFSINPGVTFNRVQVTPVTATGGGATDFSVAALAACAGSVSCLTGFESSGHACP